MGRATDETNGRPLHPIAPMWQGTNAEPASCRINRIASLARSFSGAGPRGTDTHRGLINRRRFGDSSIDHQAMLAGQ